MKIICADTVFNHRVKSRFETKVLNQISDKAVRNIVRELAYDYNDWDHIASIIQENMPEVKFVSSAEEISTPVTLRVEYYPYERYTDSGQKKARVSGRDLLEALKKMISHMELYMTPDFIEDEGLSAEEVLQSIIGSNGDGCDFISYLENETTGDVYIDEDYVDEEDWD